MPPPLYYTYGVEVPLARTIPRKEETTELAITTLTRTKVQLKADHGTVIWYCRATRGNTQAPF